MKKWLILIIAISLQQLGFAFSCPQHTPIIQKPIIFDAVRINLTREYQREHYHIESDSIQIEPRMIVLHWTARANLTDSFNAFNSPMLANTRPDLPGNLNTSAHYLVDRDGSIYQLMPDDWMARHVIGLNHYAIGIENVGGVNGEPDLTREQVEANAFLICYLKNKYPAILYLIGHMEYRNFKGTPLWLENDPHYQTEKIDPGEDFMKQVRVLTDRLHLRSAF